MNSLLLFSELTITFASFIYLYKKHQKEGLYIWILIATIISNIMITKTISISNLDINLGIITISTIFIGTNLIIQKEGETEANKIILLVASISFLSYLLYTIISVSNISYITPNIDKSFNNLVINNLFLMLINTILLLITLKINIYVYYKIKILENKLWISNIISMTVSQLFYNIMLGFIYLSYQNTLFNLIIIIIIRFLLAILTQVIGTIVIYYLTKK